MRALVTGGAGFIGSHLSERLLAGGADVIALDSFTDYYDPARKRLHLSAVAGKKGFTLVEADLATCDIGKLIVGVRCVFHLAAQVAVTTSLDEPCEDFEVNARGTLNVLEAARAHWSALPAAEQAAFRFHHVSTDEVYGSLAGHEVLRFVALLINEVVEAAGTTNDFTDAWFVGFSTGLIYIPGTYANTEEVVALARAAAAGVSAATQATRSPGRTPPSACR